MKINELERNTLSKTGLHLPRKRSQFPKELPFKIEGFELRYIKNNWGETTVSAWDGDTEVMEITLEPIAYQSIRCHSIIKAVVNPQYQGKGLGLSLYKGLIINLDMPIISNDSHSPGARKMWVRLNQDPAVDVYGFDLSSNRVFAVGPDESGTELSASSKDVELYGQPSTGVIATRKNGQADTIMKSLLRQSQIKHSG